MSYKPRLQIDISEEQFNRLQTFPKGYRTTIFTIIIKQLLEFEELEGATAVVGGVMSGRIRLEREKETKNGSI